MTRVIRRIVLTCLVCLPGCAAHPRPRTTSAPPATQSVAPQVFTVTEMRVQTFHPTPFFYVATRTTMADLGSVAAAMMSSLRAEARRSRVIISGPPVFIYHGVTEDVTKPFDLEMGMPVPPGTGPSGQFKVRTLDAFHCATVIYSGPISSLENGYESLINQMLEARLSPGDESREMYLFWEGPESHNDVLQIQMKIR